VLAFHAKYLLIFPKDSGIDLIFHTNRDSGKTDELASDSHVNVSFLSPSYEWASVSGTAEVLGDRDVVEKYYTPGLRAWLGDMGDGVHDGGPQDPRIGIIKVNVISASYSLNKKGVIGTAIDIAKGVTSGIVPSIAKVREISTEEVKMVRQQH
jgi:general stress protein 26